MVDCHMAPLVRNSAFSKAGETRSMADIAAIVPRKRLIRKLHLNTDSQLLNQKQKLSNH
jgi:hypothetical protein